MKSFQSMRYPVLLSTIAILLAGTACQRKTAPVSDSELTISLSTVCGWCTGGDSLVINARQSVYRYSPSCNLAQATETTASTDKKLWNELISLLDQEQFNKTHINLCNVCVDGCDVKATVKGKNFTHHISYGSSDNDAVAPIRPFLKKLESVHAGFRKQYDK
jgi:hypothetical protein